VQVVAEICGAVAALVALEVELKERIPGVVQMAEYCIDAVINPKAADLVIGLLAKTCANNAVKSAISQCINRNC
jgi:biotin synthase-related radical SAM superfamily protein